MTIKRAPLVGVRAFVPANYLGAPRVVFNNDAEAGAGEDLSIDEAAAAYAKSTVEEVETDQTDTEDNDESDTTDDELQASDEGAGDEDEGETADEDQAEDGEGEEDEQESGQGRFVPDDGRVKLEDGSYTTVSELKKGSLLNADYTRKTQEVAEQRRALETQSEAFKATEKQMEERTEYVTSLLQSVVPPPPDPSMLQTDPMGYMSQKAQHEQWTQHLTYLQQEQQRTQQERQAKAQETERETLDREWQELVAKAPELADVKKRDSFVADLKEHAQAYGIKPDELKAVAMDHRQALVLRDAIAYRKLQASKPKIAKKTEGRPPVQRGGKRLSPQGQQARKATDAFNRLKSTGAVEDAAAAYLASRKG